MLKSPEYSAKNLIRRSNVETICTTDDPADDLHYHKEIADDPSFATKILPTFRPDNALNIEKETFKEYIEKLGTAANIHIASYTDLKTALQKRLLYFKEMGCGLSDHSLSTAVYIPHTEAEVAGIFERAIQGETLNTQDVQKYKTALMLYLGKLYAENDFVMQLHFGALRNNNTVKFAQLGPDKGYDSIDDLELARPLSAFLDALEQDSLLPRTILYTLNPKTIIS